MSQCSTKLSRKKKMQKQIIDEVEENSINHVERLIFINEGAQHHVLSTTKVRGLLIIGREKLQSSRECTVAARSVIHISPARPFCVLNSNVSRYKIQLLKQMKIAHTAILSHAIQVVDAVLQKSHV